MSESYDLVITEGKVLISEGTSRPYTHRFETVDVGVTQGKIVKIGPGLAAHAREVINAKGLVVLPGVIDSQVHFRDPGHPHKEDLETGSKAAVLGGVTSFLDMPNTSPNTISAGDLQLKVDTAQKKSWAHFGFFIGACEENASELATLERLPHCSGVKIFMGSSTGSLLMSEDSSLKKALASGARRMAIHSEDENLLKANFQKIFSQGGEHSPALHPEWRSVEVATSSTRRIVKIAQEFGRPLHILHLTTAEELEILRQHKDLCTLEVTPQHLTLSAPDCYERLGTLAQMNPPIREQRHQEALWKALNEGLIDVIGSDHAPHTLDEKSKPYPTSPSGMPGVQTLLPLMLDHVHKGRTTLERVLEMCALEPARIYGIKSKGRIAPGFDADFTLVDLKKEWTIENKDMASRCGWTPFDGKKVTGSPEITIVAGQIATRDRKLAAARPSSVRALVFDH